MTEEYKKSEMFYHEGIYCGKEYRREFKQKDNAGVEKVVKIYGIKLKENMEQQFGKSFTIFSTCKGFGEYEEGDIVKLGYIIKPYKNKAGQDSKSHTVMWIGKATDQTSSTPQPTPENKLTLLENFEAFKGVYYKATKGKEFDPVHMLGSYIATYEAERVAELLQKCKGAKP